MSLRWELQLKRGVIATCREPYSVALCPDAVYRTTGGGEDWAEFGGEPCEMQITMRNWMACLKPAELQGMLRQLP